MAGWVSSNWPGSIHQTRISSVIFQICWLPYINVVENDAQVAVAMEAWAGSIAEHFIGGKTIECMD